MKNPLTLLPGCADDSYLKRMFTWLSRIGASPKFGSRPIGWYQIHQCHALRYLETEGGDFPVAVRHGVICRKSRSGGWHAICTPSQLFDIADSLSRKGGAK